MLAADDILCVLHHRPLVNIPGADACESLGFHAPSSTAILACSSRKKRAEWWPPNARRANGSGYHLPNDALFHYNTKVSCSVTLFSPLSHNWLPLLASSL